MKAVLRCFFVEKPLANCLMVEFFWMFFFEDVLLTPMISEHFRSLCMVVYI